jgi:hypothetical protein
MAGSEGTEFTVDENGTVTASNGDTTNTGNGAGSTNNASDTSNNSSNTEQTNTAHITNNINLSANTGGNTANENTGGSSTVKTGNANVIANLVNFVNNNIVGKGKLVVTVVNVFGSWVGNLITPGHTKEEGAQNQSASAQSTATTTAQVTVTPAPTTTTQPVSTTAGIIARAGTAETASQEIVVAANKANAASTGVHVLGESSDLSAILANTSALTINLAWFIIILPIIALAVLGKKVILPRLSRGK